MMSCVVASECLLRHPLGRLGSLAANGSEESVDFGADRLRVLQPIDEFRREAAHSRLSAEEGANDAAGVDVLAPAVRVAQHSLFELRVCGAREAQGRRHRLRQISGDDGVESAHGDLSGGLLQSGGARAFAGSQGGLLERFSREDRPQQTGPHFGV